MDVVDDVVGGAVCVIGAEVVVEVVDVVDVEEEAVFEPDDGIEIDASVITVNVAEAESPALCCRE